MREFAAQMDRLRSVFGDKAYPRERLDLIWEEVRELPPRWFEQVVSRLIGDCRQAPLMGEFREAAATYREAEHQRQKAKETANWDTRPYACQVCKDTGVFLCRRRGHEGLWAFRCCACERGANDPRQFIPLYNSGHYEEYGWVDAPVRRVS